MKKGATPLFRSLALAALLAALPAAAQQGGPDRAEGAFRSGGPPRSEGPFRAEPRPMPPQSNPSPDMPLRDFLRGHPPPPEMQGMSREERRQLRRDIHEAGRDLYHREGRHRRF